jgi:hypothetical protein
MATVNPVQTYPYNLKAVYNPITFGSGTYIKTTGGPGVYGDSAANWYVTNSGTIWGGDGVLMETASTVINQAGGTIKGAGSAAVGIEGGAGTITNAGAIEGIGPGSTGVNLSSGGTINNETGGQIYGDGVGVYIDGGAGNVTNAGTITGFNYDAVHLGGGGRVANETGGKISGDRDGVGVYIGGGEGNVTNAGTISGGIVFAGVGANMLTLQTGSVLTGDAIGSTASGATNALVLEGTGEADNNFDNFNTLTVQASGDWTLGGDSAFGDVKVSTGTLSVTGSLTATTLEISAVGRLNDYGAVTVTGAVTNAGTISGANGVYISGGQGDVYNSGGIYATGPSSNGVGLQSGGIVDNYAGAKIGAQYIGVDVNGGAGTVTNAGAIQSYGTHSAIQLNAGGSANNSGRIIGGGDGIFLAAGGTMANKSTGKVTGASDGVYASGATATVTNAGAISGANADGVALNSGGKVNNQSEGTIGGGTVGVSIVGGAGTVTNAGTISGAGFYGVGVLLGAGGKVNNQSGGTISGSDFGVYITGGAGSVTNAGTISGFAASVEFAGAGKNTLTLQTGSVLTGDAIGSTAIGATNALVLEGNGVADNNFDVFNTLTVKATSGNWTLGGDSIIGATKLSKGALNVNGDLTTSLAQSAGTTLIVSVGELTTIGTTTVSDVLIGTAEWRNAGTVKQKGGDVTVGDGAAALLDNAGTYDILDNSGIDLGASGSSLITNSGLFEKTGGTGTSVVTSAIDNTGTIEVSSGTLDLQGSLTGAGKDKVSGASTLEFGSTVAKNQTIDFTDLPSGGLSAIDLIDPSGFSGQIEKFAAMDTVDVAGDWTYLNFSENSAATLGTLTLQNVTSHADLSLKFVGDYAPSDFNIASGTTTIIAHT